MTHPLQVAIITLIQYLSQRSKYNSAMNYFRKVKSNRCVRGLFVVPPTVSWRGLWVTLAILLHRALSPLISLFLPFVSVT